MAYNFGFGVTNMSSGVNTNSSNSFYGSKFGRVVDVILDQFHPLYETYGKSQSINGVFFRSLSSPYKEDTEEPLDFAFCSNSYLKRIPLKGEIVSLKSNPSDDRLTDPTKSKTYWIDIISIWNHPHHNAYPDSIQSGDSENDFGKYFEEQDKIAPLQAFPGDDIWEGRNGQSIRFNGTKYDSNTITDNSNNGKPVTLISNGKKTPDDSLNPIVEDINEDPSSIFLTSDHTIALTQANEKRDAFDSEPEKADKFKGSQVIVNSGRLYFNARDEGAFISSKEMIGFNSKIIGIDGEKYIGLDAKKIYLGTTAFEEKEPALKGQTSTDWLDDLVSLLEGLAKTLATTPPAPPTYIGALIKEGIKLQIQLPQLKSLLKQLHSRKVFIDNK